ncbi:MAG TPA: DUF488 domain-containing protein [Gemmatimonadales bacterium]|nr:DUF488 domain-containing protein [Gemmatimonadales bacterium]
MPYLASIGYELATPATLIRALKKARVDLLVDVRAVPNSRRPGFSKKALTAACAEAGIEYLHLRGLGTPADGRAAARKGRHEEMHRIYRTQLKTLEARDDLEILDEIVRSKRRACLLCLEASPEHCHRSLIIEEVRKRGRITVEHLDPAVGR